MQVLIEVLMLYNKKAEIDVYVGTMQIDVYVSTNRGTYVLK